MTRAALCGCLAMGVVLSGATAASAWDWTVEGLFSQRVEADDNIGFDSPDVAGAAALTSITDLGVSFIGETARSRLVLTPGLRGFLSTDDEVQIDDVTPRFNGALSLFGPRSRTDATVAIVPQSTSETRFRDGSGGVRSEETIQIDGRARLGHTYQADARNEFSAGVFASFREYAEESNSFSATRSYGVDAAWRHAINARTTATLAPSITQFESESQTGSDGRNYALRAGLEHQVNPRLSIIGDAGPSVIETFGGPDAGDVTFGFVGALAVRYEAADTTYGFTLNQSVDQSGEGDVENRTTAAFSVLHDIDPRSQIGLGATVSAQTPLSSSSSGAEDRVTTQLTAFYAVDVTRNWEATVGYRFRTQDEDDLRVSNQVYLQITRGLSFLP